MAINSTYTLTKYVGNSGIVEGSVVFDATAITAADFIEINLGFKPRHVIFSNATDRIQVEFFQGMTDDNCLKTAANGTRTLETTNQGITLTTRGFKVSQNATLAVIAASKTCYFIATP